MVIWARPRQPPILTHISKWAVGVGLYGGSLCFRRSRSSPVQAPTIPRAARGKRLQNNTYPIGSTPSASLSLLASLPPLRGARCPQVGIGGRKQRAPASHNPIASQRFPTLLPTSTKCSQQYQPNGIKLQPFVGRAALASVGQALRCGCGSPSVVPRVDNASTLYQTHCALSTRYSSLRVALPCLRQAARAKSPAPAPAPFQVVCRCRSAIAVAAAHSRPSGGSVLSSARQLLLCARRRG